jgi:hypothetical protein
VRGRHPLCNHQDLWSRGSQPDRTTGKRRGNGQRQIDLRKAEIDGDEATLDIAIIMGKVVLRVPRTWTIQRKFETILGKSEDRAEGARNGSGKRLVIDGTVVMGELEITN